MLPPRLSVKLDARSGSEALPGVGSSGSPAIQRVARGTRDGRTVEIDGVLVGTVDRDARVRACVDYLDHLSIQRQLGLAD